MKKLSMTFLSGLVLLCSFFANAGEKLEAVNAEVDKQAAEIDREHGVLLTAQERKSLKLSLIANQVNTALPEATTKQKLDSAIMEYEVTDPADQRQTLIDIMGNGGGKQPPCCGTVEN